MSNTATISKWGNARGIRIPKAFCEQLDLHVGDKVEISVEEKRIVIINSDDRHTLTARMREWDGKRYETAEYDWGKPVGKELW
jgi:antitoxin MazE